MNRVTLFSSADAELNSAASSALHMLIGVQVDVVEDPTPLQDRVLLPFIATDDGRRYFGLSSIKRFVRMESESSVAIGR